MDLRTIVTYLDEYLRIRAVPDYPTALNGLQVDGGRTQVRRVAVAVDAAQATIDRAVAGGADLLIVHHGLFWDGNQPVTGRRYRRLKALLDADLPLYSAHLPLDVHPEVGNNAVLARELGIDIQGTFGEYKGSPVGVWGTVDEMLREALAARLDALLGVRVKLVPGGPERVRRVGVITGGAGGSVADAVAAGLDAFVTGEGAHHNFFDAEEGGINLLLGGHYATETWGVRALGKHLEEKFGIEWMFIDHPTGL
ncbi:Nif3-like dinuclear metal center hexameric protein [Longimicrobium terrae]|uniref:GTP cyclohydrolase 1 type 2 homolog n=1 Tax=Longimicrobium terrae TaxID=1639882 RepID=A0A841GZL6_9BACT|nr:Nif3-like dinuclear metal center hexameric protein [Longimicrobium terrae]MBB4636746.1 dinuclear metal center YbgI/SA1388 family protein [Longimicrobium terrae]MBB6071255.1 dinuclear metal center YbgI/SA1388 family protein [Longimicrobium terrae]NNC29301.1 Nif3-like dinuclear metal center hexameric protein [Longimicrobium terrae]